MILFQVNYLYKSLSLLNPFQGQSHSIRKPPYLTDYRINHPKPIDNIVFYCLGNLIMQLLFT